MTKIRCGNRENDKYIDGIRDLTVPREAGLAKNWARDAEYMFACLFPVLARATRALFSVQLLARVVFSGVCLVISLGSEFRYLINSCVRDFVQFRCKRQLRGFFLRHVLMAEEQLPHPVVVLPPDVPVLEELPVGPPAAVPVVVPAAAPVVENPANAVDAAPQEVIVRQFNSSFTSKISLNQVSRVSGFT